MHMHRKYSSEMGSCRWKKQRKTIHAIKKRQLCKKCLDWSTNL